MGKDTIGIDISDFSIEAIELGGSARRYKVKSYSRVRLSPEIVENGKILNAEKLKEVLKTMFRNARPKPMDPGRVFLSIPESKIYTRVVALPEAIKDRDIPTAARHKAEEQIPDVSENLYSNTQVTAHKKGFREVLYVAAVKEIVNDYKKIFSDLGIEVIGVTPEAYSSFAGLHPDQKKNVSLLLDIGARTTIATIFDQNGIRDNININIAGNHITAALEQKLGIPFNAAEEKKLKDGMDMSAGEGEVMLVAQGTLQPVVDELKKFVNYYEQSSGTKIEQLILIGGTSKMKGVEDYFGSNLSMPVQKGKSLLNNEATSDAIDSATFVNVVGLAHLADEKGALNFLVQQEKPHKERKERVKGDFVKGKGNLKLVIPGIIIILALIGFIVFKDKILPSENTSQPAASGPVLGIQKQLNGVVVVGLTNKNNATNFVQGEYIRVPYTDDGVLIESGYQDVVASVKARMDELVLEELDTESNGSYVIPQIILGQDLSVTPSEEEWEQDQPVTVEREYRFMSFGVEAVKTELLTNVDPQEAVQLQNWKIDSRSFEVQDYIIEDNLFLISVDMLLKRQ